MTSASTVAEVHESLLSRYDIDRWHWQADTPAFDICLGAILVQHTAWTNVEKALARLSEADVFSMETLARLPDDVIADLIRPSGTPIVKTRRLKAFCDLVKGYGSLETLFERPVEELRAALLATYGIGPETADVICLYAARQPVVVHDAYTARLFRRIGIGPDGESYEEWRSWLDGELPLDVEYRGRNHAAIVVHCKETCRVRPKCKDCVLAPICTSSRA